MENAEKRAKSVLLRIIATNARLWAGTTLEGPAKAPA